MSKTTKQVGKVGAHTPWVMGFGCRIYDSNNKSVAMTSGEASDLDAAQNQYHAALIVKAVNSHAVLVDAIQDLLDCIVPDREIPVRADYTETTYSIEGFIQDALDAARAALAQAEAEGGIES